MKRGKQVLLVRHDPEQGLVDRAMLLAMRRAGFEPVDMGGSFMVLWVATLPNGAQLVATSEDLARATHMIPRRLSDPVMLHVQAPESDFPDEDVARVYFPTVKAMLASLRRGDNG